MTAQSVGLEQRARELLAQHCECGGTMQFTKTGDCLRAIVAAIAAPAADGWRPIESAPNEDREVLAFTITGNVRIDHLASIAALKAAAVRLGDACLYSHWMPLPAAPQAQGEGA